MELPTALRQAIDTALEGVPAAKLAESVARLTQLYRAERRAASFHVGDDYAARAYLAARMPATYAAAHAAFAALAEQRPNFAPRSLLDVGAGPGTAMWAASDAWPSLNRADLVEGSAAMRRAGAALSAASAVPHIAWHPADLSRPLPALAPADLVTAGYVLNELDQAAAGALVDRLWALTLDQIVFVEPGTPAGHKGILAVRDRLIAAGAHIVAPCPHEMACPLAPPDWCHFSRRVARSRTHRLAKGGTVPWEDERFIYLAAARAPPAPSPPRVIAPIRAASGHLQLKLCTPEGTVATPTLSRRDGAAYRTAKRLDWGDVFSP